MRGRIDIMRREMSFALTICKGLRDSLHAPEQAFVLWRARMAAFRCFESSFRHTAGFVSPGVSFRVVVGIVVMWFARRERRRICGGLRMQWPELLPETLNERDLCPGARMPSVTIKDSVDGWWWRRRVSVQEFGVRYSFRDPRGLTCVTVSPSMPSRVVYSLRSVRGAA